MRVKKKNVREKIEPKATLLGAIEDLQLEIKNTVKEKIALRNAVKKASTMIESDVKLEKQLQRKIAKLVEKEADLTQKKRNLQTKIDRLNAKIDKIIKIKSDITNI